MRAYVCICNALTSSLGSFALGKYFGTVLRPLVRRLNFPPAPGEGGVWKSEEIKDAAARLVVLPILLAMGILPLDRDRCLSGIMIPTGNESLEEIFPSSSSSEGVSSGLGDFSDGVAVGVPAGSG